MKTNNYSRVSGAVKFIAPIIAAFTFLLSSCGIDPNINNSPNAVKEEDVKTQQGLQAVLIGLQVAAADFYSGDRSRIASMWTDQMYAPEGLGRPQPVEWNDYNINRDGPPQDMWTLGYRGVKLANDIIDNSPQVFTGEFASINPTMLGMAKTYKALILGELAAYFGSIPIETRGLKPAPFVTQMEAYNEVQRLLDEALTDFGNSPGAIAQDLNFGGDGALWIDVVHSLKARYYLHVKQYDKVLAEIGQGQGIKDPAGNLYAIYTDTPGEYSPWGHWTLTEAGEPIRVEASYMRDLQKDSGDTRVNEYFSPNAEGKFYGYAGRGEVIPSTDSNETDPTKIAHLRKYGAYGDKFPLITYEETVLIRAEANARAGNTATAVTDLNIIRKAAGVPDFSATDANAAITEILRQKNLQLFLEGQNYTDMRRTNTLPNPDVPKRFIYPENELNANPYVPPDDDALVKDILP